MKYKIITTRQIQNGPRFWANVTLEQIRNSTCGAPRFKAIVTLCDMGEVRGSYQFIISGYQGPHALAMEAYTKIKKELGI